MKAFEEKIKESRTYEASALYSPKRNDSCIGIAIFSFIAGLGVKFRVKPMYTQLTSLGHPRMQIRSRSLDAHHSYEQSEMENHRH